MRLRNSVKDQHGGSACFQTIFVSRLRLIRANSETAIPFYEEFLTEERVTPYLFVRDIHEKLLFGGKTSEMGITIDFDSLQDSTDITTRGYSPVLGSLHGNSDSEKFMDFLLSKKIMRLTWAEAALAWFHNNISLYADIPDPLEWHERIVQGFIEENKEGIPETVYNNGSAYIR